MNRADWLHRAAGMLLLLLAAGGCQSSNPAFTHRLVEHQAQINFTGLQSTQPMAEVNVIGATPRGWEALPIQKTSIYSHEQWRSRSHATGLGIVFIHLPLPLSPSMVLWLARQEYLKKSEDGQLIGQWTDSFDRPWFEAANSKYHVWGYAIAEGYSAWIVYFGTKTGVAAEATEFSAAARAAETIIPLSDMKILDGPRVAVGDNAGNATEQR